MKFVLYLKRTKIKSLCFWIKSKMEKGKILITGGAGYIGSHTIHYLITQGINKEDILIFDNLERGNLDLIPKDIIFIKGDLKNKIEIEDVFNNFPEIVAVIHFAAYAYVGESMEFPKKYFENNIVGGLNLLNSMKEHDVKKIVFSSTCATYGDPLKLPIDENHVQKPTNPYGESKLIFEKMLKWYDKIYGIKSVILRYFNACGASFGIGEKHNPETHIIPLIIRATIKDENINIFGNDYDTPDGTCLRDYVHVFDLAKAHLKALTYLFENDSSNQFNLGTGKGTSILELINLTNKVTGKKINITFIRRREGDPAILFANSEKAKNILGWVAEKNINDIIFDAYNWEIKI